MLIYDSNPYCQIRVSVFFTLHLDVLYELLEQVYAQLKLKLYAYCNFVSTLYFGVLYTLSYFFTVKKEVENIKSEFVRLDY